MSTPKKPEIDYEKEFYRKEYDIDQALDRTLKLFLILMGLAIAAAIIYRLVFGSIG